MFSRTLLTLSMLLSSSAWAQMWGAGIYGGMQGCSYPMQVAQGAVSEDDETHEARERIKEIQDEIKKKKTEKKKVDSKVKRSHDDVEKGVPSDYADFVFEHIENSRRCAQYKGFQSAGQAPEEIAEANMIPVQAMTTEQWNRFCDSSKPGSVHASICAGSRAAQSCKKSLTEYRKNYALAEKLQDDIEDLEEDLSEAKSALKEVSRDAADARKEQTEGGVCAECMARSNGQSTVHPQTNWASVLGNVGVGLASIYAGYQTNKMITENNANLGWPTNPYASQSYGYGLGAIGTGLGQAMAGGMGTGGFGCAGMNGYSNQYQQQMQRYQSMSSLQQEMYNLMYRMQQIQYGSSTGYLGASTSAYGYSSGLSVIPGTTNYGATWGTGLSTIPTTSTSYLLGTGR